MKTQIDILKLIESGKIENELDFERALVADRTFRVLGKTDPKYKQYRKQLRNIISDYEAQYWSATADISEDKLEESDIAEFIAEKERAFITRRKALIKEKLKDLNLTQQKFGLILGHPNKSYISELMNGVCPFSLKDIVVIHRLLKIELTDLIPTFLSETDRNSIKLSIEQLNHPDLKLNIKDFALI